MRFELSIPIEPVSKGRPRFGNGRTYTPAKTVAFESELKRHVQQYLRSMPHFKMYSKKEPLGISLLIYCQRPKRTVGVFKTARPDLDNYIKGVLDALNGVLWEDDSSIVQIHAQKMLDDGFGPRIFLAASPVN